MLLYLSKKIAIPNSVKITCLAWNLTNDWIAVGGEDGLLKILKLDTGKDVKSKSAGVVSNLSMNQNLEGHSGRVQVVVWNEQCQKLTSSDDNGLIIVWLLHKGTWYEEMINNRNKSIVKDVTWNRDGQKICIVYEDGAVIVGSVDGNRIWGKELKKLPLTNVQWSPDSKYLLFGIRNGEVHHYDEHGNFLNKLQIQCLPSSKMSVPIANIHWYDGTHGLSFSGCPQLIIAYESGHVQLMRNQYDDKPLVLSINMRITDCRWNQNGSLFAIVGSTVLTGEKKDSNIVQFFNPLGEHVQSLKLPGNTVSACSWEKGSLKLAIAIDSFIYFTNIHPDYNWCYFSETVVFSINNINNSGNSLIFWNTKNNECYQKHVRTLISIAAYKDHCVLGVESEVTSSQFALLVCNAITTTIDCKYMDLKPIWVAMNSTYVLAASQHSFLIWHYVTPKLRSSSLRFVGSRYQKERVYHVDDTPSGVAEVIHDLDKDFKDSMKAQFTNDEICCIAASEKLLLVGRRSGTVQRYNLPQVALVQRINLKSVPRTISINCNSTKMAVIDVTGTLSLVTIEKDDSDNKYDNGNKNEDNNELVRRDIWSLKWASDNPLLLAIMEKSRMYILRGNSPEEPISSTSHIADFRDLEIKSILLDEAIESPNNLRKDFVVNFEIKSLRDTRQLLEKVGIQEAVKFIESNPHPRLWRLLAEASLQNLNFKMAEMAFVHCNDYAGIQLIKRLSNIQNDQLKKAQIASYFKDYDEAEMLYLKADRSDLAIALREKLGDWFRVVELMKIGSVTSDSLLTKAYNNIGDYFMDRNNLECSKEYYQKSGNYEKLITCYQILEDYKSLESLVSLLPENHIYLEKIAGIFFSVGMCSEAVRSYIKLGAYQSAVDVYIRVNKWSLALEIANKYSVGTHVNELFQKYVSELIEKGRTFDVIQLYEQTDRYLEAAELLYKIATKEREKNKKPLALKKLFVLVALLIEKHIEFNKTIRLKSAGIRSKAVMGLEVDSVENIKLLDNPWHAAKAYHFLMLAQRQFIKGDLEAALTAAIELKHYEDLLSSEQIFCIIAVTAITCRAFDTASKAFMELEALETSLKHEYENIAFSIFSKHVPKDPPNKYVRCVSCSSTTSLWNTICPNCERCRMMCIASGRIIENTTDLWQCDTCKHSAYYTEMKLRKFCPLCHVPINIV